MSIIPAADAPVFVEGFPVKYKRGEEWLDFPVKFKWQMGIWRDLFDKHAEFVVEDMMRARAADKLVIYLSCPISSRGGGCSQTHLDIANHVAGRIRRKWGQKVWVLNPAAYQLESGEGTSLISKHAKLVVRERELEQKIDVERLCRDYPPTGGDYMRMWSRVIVEDGDRNLGNRFDAFYFIGPSDVWDFFLTSGRKTIVGGVEGYLSDRAAIDKEFKARFVDSKGAKEAQRNFLSFYAFKASAYFSLGSHDEHNIWRVLNKLRREELGVPYQIPGYFDSRQIAWGTAETKVSRGYAIPQ